MNCILFRKAYKSTYKKEQKIKDNEDITTYKEEDKMNDSIICEPVLPAVECKVIPNSELDNPACVNRKIIMNMLEKEYVRFENIRTKKDALIDLPGACNTDEIYKRNIYIMDEERILKQINNLLTKL